MDQKKLTKEFLNKGWRLWGLKNFRKSCKKLAWWQDEAVASKADRISLVFFCCVLFLH